MAQTTLSAILTRFRTVLEASPFGYLAARDPFSATQAPNLVVDTTYYLADEGLVRHTPTTNYTAARIDRVTVWLARKVKFTQAATVNELETALLQVERYLKADGPSNSYHVEIAQRRVSRIDGTDVIVGALACDCDYDVNEATS